MSGAGAASDDGRVYVYDHTVGNSIIAGSFYTGVQYPAQFGGTSLRRDYGGGWIERLVFDTNENLISINLFASNLTSPVALEMAGGLSVLCRLGFW